MPNTGGSQLFKLFGIFVAVAAIYCGVWAFDMFVAAPWAYSIGGRPTLTGRWQGQANPAGGLGGPVWLEIERGRTFSKRTRRRLLDNLSYTRIGAHPTLYGTALWCRSDGSASRYKLSGWATRDSDVVVTFQLDSGVSPHSQELNETRGHWSGSSLTLSGPMRLWGVLPGQPKSTRPASDSTSVTYQPSQRAASDTSCSR
jgi:hypothetical protein